MRHTWIIEKNGMEPTFQNYVKMVKNRTKQGLHPLKGMPNNGTSKSMSSTTHNIWKVAYSLGKIVYTLKKLCGKSYTHWATPGKDLTKPGLHPLKVMPNNGTSKSMSSTTHNIYPMMGKASAWTTGAPWNLRIFWPPFPPPREAMLNVHTSHQVALTCAIIIE